ncbi:zinc-binding dehydrogenase [Microvirga tunisiensis]|uniref:Zinc-binding dehydrogenase n=1 Tax=Microvirga tunisiensis TaxID=2108360 RepID=A0A5N7M9S8_9HYPH|nr:zinc-binding dehydrogenase [Microvirga tunisiensis]MPR05451.1 zinc-binding dehydrogenase [Microvirga tunisiensis]MPR23652.1 zinc-binding dehydrogenase [Microvirga tunisiensis]
MRAARAVGVRSPIEVASVPVPEIGEEDALVRIVASGICRSDWHIWNGDWVWNGVHLPVTGILGHEIGGIIESVGSRVKRLTPGQRVTVPVHLACGRCSSCMRGLQNMCDDGDSSHHVPGSGGWAEYMRVPNADLNCVVLPDNVDELTAAALGCRYMTAWRAVHKQGAVKGGELVAVVGCGGVGLAAVEIAACLGAEVIAVDVDDAKLEQAKTLGAVSTVNAKGLSPDAVSSAVRKLTPGDRGVDLAVDALGLEQTVNTGLYSLKKGGRLAQIGLTSQQEKGFARIPLDLIVMKELRIVGSQGNPHWAFDELLSLVSQGRLRPSRLVSREVGLHDVGSVLHDMDAYRTSGYVVITDFAA